MRGPVATHAFRGFNRLIGHEVVAWRAGFVEMSLRVRPELCNANGLLHGGGLTVFGAWRPSTSQSTFAAETEIYDQKGDLIATAAGTFRYLKGERSDGMLAFLNQKAAD